MTHKAIYTSNSLYLANLVQWHTPCRTLRSASANFLSVTRCNISFGVRGFHSDPDDVLHCWILSPDKTEWRLISATLCGWRRCFVADQLWFMTLIREEEVTEASHFRNYLKWRLTDTDLCPCGDPDDVSHCHILSPDKTEWWLISATLFGWRRCFVADQLCFMTRIREAEDSAAPGIWNSLPSNVHSCQTLTTFRRHLKSHLFQSAFATA